MNRLRGGLQKGEYRRTTRVADKALRGFVPAMSMPNENANQTLNKVALLLNRAGSSKHNPILAGLGQRWEWRIDERDRLLNVYIYQARPDFGPDKVDNAVSLGGSIFSLAVIHGVDTQAGSPADGAKQNFYRVVTGAGAGEKYAFVKSYDRDVVSVNGLQALDVDLEPVELVAQIIDTTRDWLEQPISFMDSWVDEFSVSHSRNVDDIERGNLKPYGGAKFVSFFQTGELEGVGTEVNPVTKAPIEDTHTLQLDNTEGLKHVTVRFRSKADSIYYVDVDILVMVVAPSDEACTVPMAQRCGESLLLQDTPLPGNVPDVASEPDVQVVAGTEGAPVSRDLHYIAVHGNIAGGTPKLRVTRFQAVASAEDVAGFIYEEISTLDYLALVSPADVPVGAPPYTGPVQLIVAFDKDEEKLAGVALYSVSVLDGDHVSAAVPFPGPSARDIGTYPTGETGGTDECFYA